MAVAGPGALEDPTAGGPAGAGAPPDASCPTCGSPAPAASPDASAGAGAPPDASASSPVPPGPSAGSAAPELPPEAMQRSEDKLAAVQPKGKTGPGQNRLAAVQPTAKTGNGQDRLAAVQPTAKSDATLAPGKGPMSGPANGDNVLGKSEAEALEKAMDEKMEVLTKAISAIVGRPLNKAVQGISQVRSPMGSAPAANDPSRLSKSEINEKLGAKARTEGLSKNDRSLINQYSLGQLTDLSKLSHLLS